jgi:hypothetical protein
MPGPFCQHRSFDRLRMLGPFDKLRVGGGGVASRSHLPFGLSLSRAPGPCMRFFDEVKANRGNGPQPPPPLERRLA